MTGVQTCALPICRRQTLFNAHANSPSFKTKTKPALNSDHSSTTHLASTEKFPSKINFSKPNELESISNEDNSSEEDSIVEGSDSSDDDLEDLMPTETREKIEKLLIQASTFVKKADYQRQEEKETAAVNEERIRKYAMDFVAGSLLQLTSFGIGGFATVGTGNPWLFPVVVPILNELLGDKIAQLVRASTLVVPETQQWFAIQRQLGHALGDLFVACANKDPSKKFDIKVNGETKKVTAAEALKHMGIRGAMNAWGKNFLVRGLPFAWFFTLYALRDWQLYDDHGGIFSANATSWCHSHTPDVNCTNVAHLPSNIDPVALRTGIVFLVGMLAGATTALTSQ